MLEVVATRREAVTHPVAVKLSPFYSSLAQLRRRLDGAGADGLVLFNRFYQPDIDVESLEVVPRAAPLRLRRSCCCGCAGSAILSGRVARRSRPPAASTPPSTP